MLSQAKLKEALKYDPETGIFIWIKQTGPSVIVGNVAGCKRNGYIVIGINGAVYYAHRLAWFYVCGYFPEHDIDHINRDKADNRIINLRQVTRQCNLRNTGNHITSKSGVKGVYFYKPDGKWRARIKINNRDIDIGKFYDFDEAVCHRLAAEQAEDWNGCDQSSPACRYVRENIQHRHG